jgi:Family of unknown function (DUF6000)
MDTVLSASEHASPGSRLYYDQTWAMAGLVIVDRSLGTEMAAERMGEWGRWAEQRPSAPQARGEVELLDSLIGFATEVAAK